MARGTTYSTDGRARLVAAVEQDAAKLAAHAVSTLQERFPAYAAIAPEDLLPGVEGDLRRALNALRERRGPTDVEIAAAAAIGAERAREGVPLEVMLHGFQVVAQLAWTRIKAAAPRSDVSPDELLKLAEDVWDWVNAVTLEAANAHRQVDLATAQQVERQRFTLITTLLAGGLSTGQARAALAALGLPAADVCRAFRARPVPHMAPTRAERLLDGRWTHLPVAAIDRDGDIVGVIAGDAVPIADEMPVGLGPSGAARDLSHSFDLASRALDAILAFRFTGAHTLADLGLRAVVVSEADVGDGLVTELMAPLQATRGMADDIVRSVRAYLSADGNVDQAAKVIGIHPNTLRYRLRRFQALANVDLEHVEDLVRVWWAIQRDTILRNRSRTLSENGAGDDS